MPAVDLEASVELDAPPARIYAEVADLGTYPEWLGIVLEAERDGEGAWFVELGARLGPVKAGKRVRMVRVVDESPTHVRFERDERDGEEHSSWVLDASLAGSTLTMHLHYGGSLFVPMLDKILQAEIDQAGDRLRELLRVI